MSNIDEFSGYKHLSAEAHAARWRFRLFVAMRNSSVYRELLAKLKQDGVPPLHEFEMVEALHLVKDGEPLIWAFHYVTLDRHGQFDPDNELDMIRAGQPSRSLQHLTDSGFEASGWMQVVAWTLGGWTSVYIPESRHEDPRYSSPFHSTSVDTQKPLVMGEQEWRELESQAIEGVKKMVSALRQKYTANLKMVKAGYEPQRELQIQRLAFRLLRQSGRNPPHIDRRLCQELGLDVPPWK
jgi:hypothetical protein